MKISALRGTTRTIFVDVEGEEEKVRVDYAPGNLTFGLGETIQEAVDAGTLTEAKGMLQMLNTILVDWDLEEDILGEDNEPTGEVRKMTTEPEDLKKVPIPFIGLVFQKINEDQRPNVESSPNSNGSLPQTEPSEVAPSGTSSFGLQNDTASLPGSS